MQLNKSQQQLAIILILLILSLGLTFFTLSSDCRPDNCQDCSKSCNSNNDCQQFCPCGCIAKGQQPNKACENSLPCDICACIEGECQSQNVLLSKALEAKDLTKCLESTDPFCLAYCQEKVEAAINQGHVVVSTPRKEYSPRENITFLATNQLETIYYTTFSLEFYQQGQKMPVHFLTPSCSDSTECLDPSAQCSPLLSGQTINFTWNQLLFDFDEYISQKPAGLGTYKLTFCYSQSCDSKKQKCSSTEFKITRSTIQASTTYIKDEGEPMIVTLENIGSKEQAIQPYFMKLVLHDGTYTKEDFLNDYQEFENACFEQEKDPYRQPSNSCTKIILEPGQKKEITLDNTYPIGKYRLATMAENRVVYSNDFKIVVNKQAYQENEKYCEENTDCAALLTKQTYCCPNVTGECLNKISPRILAPFEDEECSFVSCPETQPKQCSCINNHCQQA